MSFRLSLILATVLAAWSAAAFAETIKVGVTPGPHAQILEAVKPIAAILREDPKGPYVNLIAVRAAYHSPEVKEFVLAKLKGAVLPSW
ncbi:hypothetical protein WI604_06100 [Bradyrhizobium symbiodeficiens]